MIIKPKFDFDNIITPATGEGKDHSNVTDVENYLKSSVFNEYERVMVAIANIVGDFNFTPIIEDTYDEDTYGHIGAAIRNTWKYYDDYKTTSDSNILSLQNGTGYDGTIYITEINDKTESHLKYDAVIKIAQEKPFTKIPYFIGK